tara:strand:+ start:1585 stop:1824 length:240 start_codon:yes stop_codon:yes gene_type:complete
MKKWLIRAIVLAAVVGVLAYNDLLFVVPMFGIPLLLFMLFIKGLKGGQNRGRGRDAARTEYQRYGDNPGDPLNTSRRVK